MEPIEAIARQLSAPADDTADNMLGRLLDDVHRMAGGIGAISQLAVELTGRPVPVAPSTFTEREQYALDVIEGLLLTAVQFDRKTVSVPIDHLATVLRLACEARGDR